jgi:hypothetical protein
MDEQATHTPAPRIEPGILTSEWISLPPFLAAIATLELTEAQYVCMTVGYVAFVVSRGFRKWGSR